MVEENIIQEFQLKNIDETRICFIEEINQKALMTKNHEKVCTTLNLVKNYLFQLLQLLNVFQFMLLRL